MNYIYNFLKNNKKTILLLSLITIIFTISFTIINPSDIKNDSGFDSSYGGGGGGSSSIGGGSSSSRSGGASRPSSIECYGLETILITTAIEITIFVVLYTIISMHNRKIYINEILIVSSIVLVILFIMNVLQIFVVPIFSIIIILYIIIINLEKLFNRLKLKKYAKEEEKLCQNYNLSPEIKNEFFNIYVKIQDAWMNFDYEELRKNCTDELYNQYISQLEILKVKNQQNKMRDYKLNNCIIENISKSNNIIAVKIFASISLVDEIYNMENDKVIKGGLMTNNYEMTFIKSSIENYSYCPNCGSKIEETASTECKYCHTPIVKIPNNWVLSKKNISTKKI